MKKTEFLRHRRELINIIGEDSIVILAAAPEIIRNCDVHYTYRQDSNFFYLTGFPEPSALAVIIPNRKQGQYILFCSEKNAEQQKWNGNNIGLEEACEIYGADDAFPINDIDDIVPGLMENYQRIYYPIGYYPEFDSKVAEWMNQIRTKINYGITITHKIFALDQILHEMRLIKTQPEIDTIRRACNITIQAHKRAMKLCRHGLFEFHINAEINHELTNNGYASVAFPTIVASGENGSIYHYKKANSKLKNGDLLLIDAGAEFNHYASDITRTIPVNGRFTPEQKIIYELVLLTQQVALSKIYPNSSLSSVSKAAIDVVTRGLIELGLLVGEFETLIKKEAYKRFFVPHICHWLGIDVHDPGDYKVDGIWRALEAGMVMTIEPGIYIPVSDDIPKKWRGICIRIEDVVLVTKTGVDVLSSALPRTVKEIEKFMA